MDEIRSYSVLDFVRLQENSELCRILFLASIVTCSEEALEFFNTSVKEHFDDRVTGLMLVYPNYIINLVESSEDEIFRVCSYFVNVQPKFLGISKYFPIENGVEERFFEKWYARRVVVDDSENMIGVDCESFEKFTNIYCRLTKDVYSLCNEMREARTTSRACLANKLDKLGSLRDSHLPDEKTLRALLESSWGDSVEKLVDDYWNEVCSRDIDEEIWPFPENQFPPIETIENT